MLLSVGQNKIKTIKVYRELTGAGLAEAKRDVENAPIKVIGGLSENEAHDVSAALRQLGNITSVEVDSESIIPNTTLQNYDVFEAVKSSVTDYSDPWDKPKKSKKADKKAKKLQMAQEKAATKAAIKSAKKTIAEAKASSYEDKSKKSSTRQGVLILFISALVYGVIFILSFLGAKGSNNKKAEPPVIVQPTMTSYMDGKYLSKEDIMNEIGSSIVFNYFANDNQPKYDISEELINRMQELADSIQMFYSLGQEYEVLNLYQNFCQLCNSIPGFSVNSSNYGVQTISFDDHIVDFPTDYLQAEMNLAQEVINGISERYPSYNSLSPATQVEVLAASLVVKIKEDIAQTKQTSNRDACLQAAREDLAIGLSAATATYEAGLIGCAASAAAAPGCVALASASYGVACGVCWWQYRRAKKRC